MTASVYHTPVLLKECLDALVTKPNGIYLDLTYGSGTFSKELLKRIDQNGRVISFDKDNEAIANKTKDDRLFVIKSDFKYLENFCNALKINKVDGIIADLGVSSHQLDEEDRGFSYRFDTRLDMRMDRNTDIDAYKIINEYSDEQLYKIFKQYGEIVSTKKLVDEIIKERATQKIESTYQLKAIVEKTNRNQNPNKILSKAFQALRIEVNQELESLKILLKKCSYLLSIQARIVIISYHSLEDRIVKNFMQSGNFEGKVEKNIQGKTIAPLRQIGKLIQASEEEIRNNVRARSAKMRIAEKI